SLFAQGGDPVPVDPPPSEPEPRSNEEVVEPYTEDEIRDLIRDEVNALRRDNGFLFSANGIDLWAGGGVEFEYRSAQENSQFGTLRPQHGAGKALSLDRAKLFVEGSYFDHLGATDMQLITSRIEIGYERDELSLDQAWLAFNRPLTRFDLPLFKEYLSDSIMIGLARPFWANQHRVSESYSLLDESLARDERLQATWTFSGGGAFYALAGIGGGSRLALDGEVDGTLNYALLQDDRESFFDLRSDKDEVSDSLTTLFGAGVALDLAGRGDVIPRKRVWLPTHASAHLDVLHLGLWYAGSQLAANEKTMIEGVIGRASEGSSKWRAGATMDLNLALDTHVLYLRAQYAHAKDGDFSRNFTVVEASLAADLGDAFPLLTVIQPYARASWLQTSADGPTVGSATAVNGPDAMQAWAAADRFQFTAGVALWFHRRVALKLEYVLNNEEFSVPSGTENSVDNDVFLINLSANF
ncbi:MAG: hypothetical protein KDB07_08620, partial [Planctomycetes bacterium]|nr:hypothetical protein [Planctomycetota bacterium]